MSSSQHQAEVESVCWQLAVLGTQLQAVTLFDGRLQMLIVRLQSLTRTDPAVSALLAQLQVTGGSMSTVGSLVARVALLDRLLAHLTRVDPLAARRLARTLPALHTLLAALLAARHSGGLRGSEPVGSSNATVEVLLRLLAPRGASTALAGGVIVSPLAGGASVSPSAQSSMHYSLPQASSEAIHTRSGRGGIHHASTSALRRGAGPSSAPPLGSGLAASASGGLGSGAPAAVALLAVLAVWLLDTVLAGHVSLDLVPRRATLLASRLERPG